MSARPDGAAARAPARDCVATVVGGFIAGAIGVAVGHQATWFLLNLLGAAHYVIFSMRPVPPFSVPQIGSHMFWGGTWGIVLAWALTRRGSMNYWLFAGLFGLIAPTLVGWIVVPLIKGTPLFGGPPWHIQAVRPLPNIAFTLLAALVLRLLQSGFVWR